VCPAHATGRSMDVDTRNKSGHDENGTISPFEYTP
jgi:hypothetical protein